MSELRKYDCWEIDRMRAACRRIVQPPGRAMMEVEVLRGTEELLRTYMQNGTSPEELEERAKYAGCFVFADDVQS